MISPKASAAPSRWCPVRLGRQQEPRERHHDADEADVPEADGRGLVAAPAQRVADDLDEQPHAGEQRDHGLEPARTGGRVLGYGCTRVYCGGHARLLGACFQRGAGGRLGPTPARRDRVISIDHTSNTSLPCGQKGRVRQQRVGQLALDHPRGLLGGGVLVHARGPAEVGELGEPRRAADHGRPPGRQRLHDGDRVGLVVAEEGHHARSGDALAHLRAVEGRDEPDGHPLGHAELLGQGPEVGLVGAGAEDLDPGLGPRLEQVGQRLDGLVVALVALEPADADDQAGLGRDHALHRRQRAAVPDHRDGPVGQPEDLLEPLRLVVRDPDQGVRPAQQRREHLELGAPGLLAEGAAVAAGVEGEHERRPAHDRGDHRQRRDQGVHALHVDDVVRRPQRGPEQPRAQVPVPAGRVAAEPADQVAVDALGPGQLAGQVGGEHLEVEALLREPASHLGHVVLDAADLRLAPGGDHPHACSHA